MNPFCSIGLSFCLSLFMFFQPSLQMDISSIRIMSTRGIALKGKAIQRNRRAERCQLHLTRPPFPQPNSKVIR